MRAPRTIFTRIKERDRRTMAFADIGFTPSLRKKCPFPHDVGRQSKRSISYRGDTHFCTWCLRGYTKMPDDDYILDPRVMEEIGGALFPPPQGFVMVDDGLGIAPNR